EALTMSDLVAVMQHGRIAQTGTPRMLYEAPANLFVADFLGDSNLVRGKIRDVAGDEVAVETAGGTAVRAMRGSPAAQPGAAVVVLIRPEDISLDALADSTGADNTLAGRVLDVGYHGDTFKLEVAVAGGTLKVKLPREQAAAMTPGSAVRLKWSPRAARVFAAGDDSGASDDDH